MIAPPCPTNKSFLYTQTCMTVLFWIFMLFWHFKSSRKPANLKMCRRPIKYAFFSSLIWSYHPQMPYYVDLHSTSELRLIKLVQFTNRVVYVHVMYKLLLKSCLKRSWWVWSCRVICKVDFSKKSSGQLVKQEQLRPSRQLQESSPAAMCLHQ